MKLVTNDSKFYHLSNYYLQGVREVTLLGQNVNSYRDHTPTHIPSLFSPSDNLSPGFFTIYKVKEGGRRFAELLHYVAQVSW